MSKWSRTTRAPTTTSSSPTSSPAHCGRAPRGHRYFASLGEFGAWFRLAEDWTIGLVFEYEEGRDTENSTLAGLARRRDTVEAQITLARRFGDWTVAGVLQPDLLGRGKGFVTFVGLGYDRMLTDQLRFSARFDVSLGSHLVLTSIVDTSAALVIFALAFWLEDGVYATVVRAALDDPAGTTAQTWRVDEAPEELRALAARLPDGIREREEGGRERHAGLRTDRSGTRWIAVVDAQEVEGDAGPAVILAAAVLGLSGAALVVGFRVARRTLRPLQRPTERLGASAPPTPAELVAGASDDEIGFLARELARLLEARERAFAREREFLRDASHELRNPLGVLQGTRELLRENGTATAEAYEERLARAAIRRLLPAGRRCRMPAFNDAIAQLDRAADS